MREAGERLRARARELGWTDAEVARRLDLDQARYSNYVNANREPDFATFVRICRVLATTPNEVLGFDLPTGDDRTAAAKARISSVLARMEPDTLDLAGALLELLEAHAAARVARRPEEDQGRGVGSSKDVRSRGRTAVSTPSKPTRKK
jgi:transcriptional regulator with XRE-family HTH domain